MQTEKCDSDAESLRGGRCCWEEKVVETSPFLGNTVIDTGATRPYKCKTTLGDSIKKYGLRDERSIAYLLSKVNEVFESFNTKLYFNYINS